MCNPRSRPKLDHQSQSPNEPAPPAPSLPRPTTPHARRSGDHRAAAVTQPPLLSLQRSLFPVLPPTCPSAVLPADRILHLNPTLGPVRGHVVPLPVPSPRRPPSPPPPSTRYLARPLPRPGTQGKRISLKPRPAPGESCLRRSRAHRLTDSRRALAQSSDDITSSSPRPPQRERNLCLSRADQPAQQAAPAQQQYLMRLCQAEHLLARAAQPVGAG
ncbi:hypothetical protein V8E36_005706 [Tilletia maclaganii]